MGLAERSLFRALTPALTSWGRSRSLKQSAGRASDSGVLVDIPNLTEREHLGYVCNPRSLKEGTEMYVSSPQSLNLRCMAKSLTLLLTGKENMRHTCCSLNIHAITQNSCCNYRMPMCIGSFSYTRSRLVSQSDPQFVGQFRRTSPFPPSGNEGYISNQDIFLSALGHCLLPIDNFLVKGQQTVLKMLFLPH